MKILGSGFQFGLANVCVMLCVFVTTQANAQNDPAKAALAKAQYMLRQVNSEKSAIQVELTSLKTELTEVQSKLKSLEGNLADNKKNSSGEIKRLNEKYEKLLADYEAQIDNNRTLTDVNSDLEVRLNDQTKNYKACYKDNVELFSINKEILGNYEGQGFWDALARKEPITALQKVKIENMIQDYRFKVDDLKIEVISDQSLQASVTE